MTRAELSVPGDPEAQLHQPRLAEVVAGILRSRIVDGQLADGSRLPKQDELLREFRVSRPSLREALRILEAEGLITVQRGNVGGAIVRAPSAQSSAYVFGLVLQSRHVVLEDLAEAIRNVEPVAAALCARRKDRKTEVVPRLRAVHEEAEGSLDDDVDFTRTARRFHEEFVRSCGNTTLIVMLGTLELMWSHQERQWVEHARDSGRDRSRGEREEVLDVHSSILDAIERGDADYAGKLAQGHLRESRRYTLAEGHNELVRATPIGALSV